MMFNEIIKIDKCKKLKFIFFLYRVVAWFWHSLYKMVHELYVDSFLELMSSSGTVGGFVLYGSMVLSTSVMSCAFYLSDVYRCLGGVAFAALDHVDEVSRCKRDCLFDTMNLACVFECTWWQSETVLNERAGFTFLWVALFVCWRPVSSYVCWTFAFTRKPRRLRGRLCAMEGIQKKTFASALRLTMRKCLAMTLLRFGEAEL